MVYIDYVKRAKELLTQIECHQVEIAYLATIVCEIKHGGRQTSKEYNLTKFAKDIGVNRKTLSGWVLIYKNIIKKIGIHYKEVTKADWEKASLIDDYLRQEIRIMQTIEGNKRKKGAYKELSEDYIKDIYGKAYSTIELQQKINNWNRYVIFIKNNLQSKDLNLVSASSLLSIKENMDAASDIILRHLTMGKKNDSSIK
jgi:tyrosine-protein phosphatase YwqE